MYYLGSDVNRNWERSLKMVSFRPAVRKLEAVAASDPVTGLLSPELPAGIRRHGSREPWASNKRQAKPMCLLVIVITLAESNDLV